MKKTKNSLASYSKWRKLVFCIQYSSIYCDFSIQNGENELYRKQVKKKIGYIHSIAFTLLHDVYVTVKCLWRFDFYIPIILTQVYICNNSVDLAYYSPDGSCAWYCTVLYIRLHLTAYTWIISPDVLCNVFQASCHAWYIYIYSISDFLF